MCVCVFGWPIDCTSLVDLVWTTWAPSASNAGTVVGVAVGVVLGVLVTVVLAVVIIIIILLLLGRELTFKSSCTLRNEFYNARWGKV